jgi:hypothetical protein
VNAQSDQAWSDEEEFVHDIFKGLTPMPFGI